MMLARLRSGLTFANVCSFLALVVACGTGGAYAADTIFSSDIVDGQVKRVDIAAGAVDSSKVALGSLTGADLADGQIRGVDVADGAIATTKVLNESLRAADIEQESLSSGRITGLDGSDIDDDGLTGADIADLTGGDITDDGLSGADVYEASLATVPSAVSAEKLGGHAAAAYMRSATKWKSLRTVGERLPVELGNPACSGNRTCTATLRCDPGDILLSGGFNQIDNGTRLYAAFPFNANGSDHKYVAHWENNSTADTIELNVLCADQP